MEPKSLTHIVSLSPAALVVLEAKIHNDALANHDLFTTCDSTPSASASDLGQLEKSQPTRCYQILLLLSGFFMIFQVNGINSIFGVFQEYYTSDASNIPEAQGQDALVSLVGAIGYGLTYGGGIFVNQLVMRVENIKLVTLFGAVVTSLGLFLASFCTKLWHLYVTQAVLFGFGATFLYFPIISITPRFFDRNRGFAMGFVLAGNGVGGLVLSPTTQMLIEHVGIRWTLRILALVTLLIMTPVAFALRQAPGFEERRLQITMIKTRSLFKQPHFYSQAIGTALQAAGNIIPLFYLNRYAISVLGYSGSSASILLAVNNVANSFSRVFMGLFADRVGRQNTLIASVFMSAIVVLTLWYNATQPRFVAFIVTYGIFAGGYNALLPTTIAELYGSESYDTVSGMIYFLRGVGTVMGPPTAGALLGARSRTASSPTSSFGNDLPAVKNKYDELAIYAGILLLCASLCACGVRWGETRVKGRWNWKA